MDLAITNTHSGPKISLDDAQVHELQLHTARASAAFGVAMKRLNAPRLSARARGKRRKKRRHGWREELQRLASPWDNATSCGVVLRIHAHARKFTCGFVFCLYRSTKLGARSRVLHDPLNQIWPRPRDSLNQRWFCTEALGVELRWGRPAGWGKCSECLRRERGAAAITMSRTTTN